MSRQFTLLLRAHLVGIGGISISGKQLHNYIPFQSIKDAPRVNILAFSSFTHILSSSCMLNAKGHWWPTFAAWIAAPYICSECPVRDIRTEEWFGLVWIWDKDWKRFKVFQGVQNLHCRFGFRCQSIIQRCLQSRVQILQQKTCSSSKLNIEHQPNLRM